MTSSCRKRRHAGHEAGVAASGTAAQSLAALPLQTGCCRVAGCQEPLTPGYHKVGCSRVASEWGALQLFAAAHRVFPL